ncbi:MAG TPA: hypothetical protein PKW95_09670 [bacterium]|nr:hypothetical protein [bacterium]
MNRAILLLCLFALVSVVACAKEPTPLELTVTAQAGPAGSLIVSGRCNAPDGTRLLVHARGGAAAGAQVEQAAPAEVRNGAYRLDLGLYETLPYDVDVILSPRFNDPGALSATAPEVIDPAVQVTTRENSWEAQAATAARLGSPEQADKLLADHREALTEARRALRLAEEQLRDMEKKKNAKEAARWLRLYLERKRGTVLDGPGVDPLFPTAHGLLRQLDKALLKRYHAILSLLTGASDEYERMSKSWTTVERLNARLDAALAAPPASSK